MLKKLSLYLIAGLTALYVSGTSWLLFRTIFEEMLKPSVRFGGLAIMIYLVMWVASLGVLITVAAISKLNWWVVTLMAAIATLAGLALSTFIATKNATLATVVVFPVILLDNLSGQVFIIIMGLIAVAASVAFRSPR
ncbi:hypothetical protein EPO04_03140 [Patescibacteria group bacterium]|nr:MAG: hypothetical protein EPO04_03140 [Patescibacteria group bacterium]